VEIKGEIICGARKGELPFLVLMILYAIILLSFSLLMFVECGFKESMRVLVVSVVLFTL